MPFARPSLTALQQQALADIAASLPTGAPLPNSVLRVLGFSMAGFAHGHYGFEDWIARQSVPFTATAEHLEAWAALKGVTRKLATPAKGAAAITATGGATIPAGTILRRGDGFSYATDAAATVAPAGGTVFVAFTAVEAGAAGNAATGTALSLSNPVPGVTSAAVANAAVTGGADDEADDALRTRMLERYAAPAQGGSEADYVSWAKEVPGVTRAWCRPGALGAVTVYVMMDVAQAANGGFPQGTAGGAALEGRLASATGDLLTVADHIHGKRPATALVQVAAPTTQGVGVILSTLTPDTPAIRAAIDTAIRQLWVRIGTPLGMTVHQSDLTEAINAVPGLESYTMTNPSGVTVIPAGKLPDGGLFGVS